MKFWLSSLQIPMFVVDVVIEYGANQTKQSVSEQKAKKEQNKSVQCSLNARELI